VPNAVYGAYFLQDLLNGFVYTDAIIIGKSVSGIDTYEYDQPLVKGSWLLSADALNNTDLNFADLCNESAHVHVKCLGLKTFAADAANFKISEKMFSEGVRDSILKSVEI
jgi:hypothetical protein